MILKHRRPLIPTPLWAFAVAVAMAVGAAASTSAGPARAATETLVWQQYGPLTGYGVSTECNPGGTTNFPCGPSDVAISTGSDSTGQFTQVTANPRGIATFVNAIGNIHLTNTTPDGQPIRLTTYRYVLAFRLPRIPTTTSAPWIGEQMHEMIQFWDGSNRLWNANKHTLEAAVFWKLNPWDPNHGRVMVYTTGGNGALSAVDTGFSLPLDTNWHYFEINADLRNRVWAGIGLDGTQWNPLTNLPLAQIYHPDWGNDLSLILTGESENAYPGSTNPIVTQWTTDFRDVKLYRQD
ncbi:hypothetical protein KGA66_22670 [Actinocrinis puniceicyclus]|uniref:Polysaccharide lyase-like protein n=1 Tax=Actinocrinis puniceicyclus TaxID=977794 RepID=A0A8J7WSD2_9ACTN|nr:hypothetical protein [Actinocrinis puniceicyclus]MBS2965870.1 hypothetical protein [Actinocrinis puniceicyclus]